MKIIQLSLTCAHQAQADTITTSLLEKRLVACVKMMPITAHFLWQSAIESSTEVLLIMESEESKFNAIEQEIAKLHSYKTFVLTAVPVTMTSGGVAAWIKESVQL
jgi:periplasmic divalent cation tolerance protein